MYMINLGNVDAEKVKKDFLEKFKNAREDYDEYEFGVIKGEKMSTTIYHKPCERVFESRPYLFIQEDWVKKCPYCYPYKKNELTTADIRNRIARYNNRIELIDHVEKYIGRQKIRHVYLKCRDCGHEFSRNFQNIDDGFLCPSCKNLK